MTFDLGIAVEVAVGVLAQLAISARRSGELSQKVSDHTEDIRNLWSAKGKQDDKITKQGERLASVEAKVGLSR